ncbi:MAG TPA: hypothetical protein DDY49_00900, partial [Paenibacillaceae bacterium]|nr:hypothetical protein [Paenibacillaceae bacterium]
HISIGKKIIEQTGCQVFCKDIHTLWKLHNKWEFYKLVKNYGYAPPPTTCVTSHKELKDFLARKEEKVVIKPVYSRFGSQVYFYEKGDHVPHLSISKERPWIVQDFVQGTQYCSYSVSSHGKLLAHSLYSTKYTAGPGATVFFQHIENVEIQKFVSRIVKQENFTGQIAFDFFIDAQGRVYPIECNPRSTSGIHLFDGNKEFALSFIKENNKMITPAKDQAYMLGIPMLLYGVKSGTAIKHLPSFFKDFKGAKDVIFSKKDMKPFFYQIPVFFNILRKAMKYKIDLTAVTTMDIEWGENL